MRNTRPLNYGLLMLALLIVGVGSTAGQSDFTDNYDLSWNSIDGGGGTSVGGSFILEGSIGQPDAASMSGGTFSLEGGFWPGRVIPVHTCPADISNPHDGMVNTDDLVYLITHWSAAGGPADINHDNVVNIDDLVTLITSWGMCP